MESRTNYMRFALAAATTLVVAACGGGKGGPAPAPMGNTAPSIAAISDRSADQDTLVGPIEFGVSDAETPANQLTVTVGTAGTAVFPADGVMLTGTGPMRAITLMPLEAATGSENITVAVIDGSGLRTTRSFQVTVNARAASMRDWSLTTFAKAETDAVTPVNGYTFTQDADDPAIYAPLLAGVE